MKLVKRYCFARFQKSLTSRPVAFGIKEIFSDGSSRFIFSERKSYNYNALVFGKRSELESYISSQGMF